jgi:hypothetical protein
MMRALAYHDGVAGARGNALGHDKRAFSELQLGTMITNAQAFNKSEGMT